MRTKPITIPEVLLLSAAAGVLAVVFMLFFASGAAIGSPIENLSRFFETPRAWLVVVGTFVIGFAAVVRWLLMMYWQQRQ